MTSIKISGSSLGAGAIFLYIRGQRGQATMNGLEFWDNIGTEADGMMKF
jgi:hypothetical protein